MHFEENVFETSEHVACFFPSDPSAASLRSAEPKEFRVQYGYKTWHAPNQYVSETPLQKTP